MVSPLGNLCSAAKSRFGESQLRCWPEVVLEAGVEDSLDALLAGFIVGREGEFGLSFSFHVSVPSSGGGCHPQGGEPPLWSPYGEVASGDPIYCRIWPQAAATGVRLYWVVGFALMGSLMAHAWGHRWPMLRVVGWVFHGLGRLNDRRHT